MGPLTWFGGLTMSGGQGVGGHETRPYVGGWAR